MDVTRDQVRALLEPAGEDRSLVVLEGRTEVVATALLTSPGYAGAIEIASGRDLAGTLPSGAPSEHDLDALAARLRSVVVALGA
ncbi:hypothetical protein [Streptomyces antimicrobicus]|uniref:Uncharacterized protein n=1 Tax=Streptomyces antimicrobicus TaxID=2883108 RepID=A0ABS8B0S5_9ACTN|nr:hypothetical protein [Streptomyces antimicrobicus]MCB5178213.1 hypothetical protein [Streptomyces antimicrobicus]